MGRVGPPLDNPAVDYRHETSSALVALTKEGAALAPSFFAFNPYGAA